MTLIKKERPKSNLNFPETEINIAKEPDELDSLIETFKLQPHEETVNNSFDENKKLD